jgi:hypothetical protein
MAKRVADLLVDVFLEAGVERGYGVSGDSLNGITDSTRTRKQIEWVHTMRGVFTQRHVPSGVGPCRSSVPLAYVV